MAAWIALGLVVILLIAAGLGIARRRSMDEVTSTPAPIPVAEERATPLPPAAPPPPVRSPIELPALPEQEAKAAPPQPPPVSEALAAPAQAKRPSAEGTQAKVKTQMPLRPVPLTPTGDNATKPVATSAATVPSTPAPTSPQTRVPSVHAPSSSPPVAKPSGAAVPVPAADNPY